MTGANIAQVTPRRSKFSTKTDTCFFNACEKLKPQFKGLKSMTPQTFLSLSPDQEAHLDAWSTVYVEAHIKQILNISLSRFLHDPGMHLLMAWLKTPPPASGVSSTPFPER
jgi:hypothetical protein